MKATTHHLDERKVEIVRSTCTWLYGFTMMALIGAMLYREFVTGQPVREFEDMAVIVTANVLIGIVTVLYRGGVSVPRLKPLAIVGLYLGFVAIGFAFTIIKDAYLLGKEVDLAFALGKLRIIATICGLMVAGYGLFAWLGNRRIEREIS